MAKITVRIREIDTIFSKTKCLVAYDKSINLETG